MGSCMFSRTCHRGPIYRVLSRFTGDRLHNTNAGFLRSACLCSEHGIVMAGWLHRQAAHAEAGQNPINQPSMTFFGQIEHHVCSCQTLSLDNLSAWRVGSGRR